MHSSSTHGRSKQTFGKRDIMEAQRLPQPMEGSGGAKRRRARGQGASSSMLSQAALVLSLLPLLGRTVEGEPAAQSSTGGQRDHNEPAAALHRAYEEARRLLLEHRA